MLYEVEIKTTIIVEGQDILSAVSNTNEDMSEVLSNEDFSVHVKRPILKCEVESVVGWDGECIPYGGDKNTRIENL